MTIRRFREGVLSTPALRFLQRRDRVSHAADRLIFNSSTAPSFTRIRSRTCRHQEIVRASLKHCDGAVAASFRTEREKGGAASVRFIGYSNGPVTSQPLCFHRFIQS
jgi:hypothetical protein